MSSTVIGIDLGTVNSCVCFLKDNRPFVIPDEQGRRTTPSIYAIGSREERLVGYSAAEQMDLNPTGTIFGVKRLIGRPYDSPEVAETAKRVPYKIIPAPNGDAWVEINGVSTSPEEVSAQVLVRMKEIAEAFLGEKVKRAVITVPAHFNDSQRQATKDAGRIAGLDVLRIINEPTAAALAYGLDLDDGTGQLPERTIAVFDLGGGTFDISILEFKGGVFNVLATNGDTALGGEDIDLAVVNWIIDYAKEKHGVDIGRDKRVLQRLKVAGRDLKHRLSIENEVTTELAWVAHGVDKLEITLSRKELDRIVRPIINRLEQPCRDALEDAGLKPESITDVILVGGMTRMPAVKKCAARVFGKEPLERVDVDEAVAVGAAIQSGLLQGLLKGVSLMDVTSLSLGIEVQGGKVHTLIPRNTKVPVKVEEIFTTSAPNQKQVSIHVVQGESSFAPDNKTLGRFELVGLRPAPRGEPDIAVTFSIDAEGIVSVSAKDLETGEEKQIEIVISSGLTDEKLKELMSENRAFQAQVDRRAEKSAGVAIDDKPKDELSQQKNRLTALIFQTQFKLDTEGQRFKGKERELLEKSLQHSRRLLEAARTKDELIQATIELETRAEALDEYLATIF